MSADALFVLHAGSDLRRAEILRIAEASNNRNESKIELDDEESNQPGTRNGRNPGNTISLLSIKGKLKGGDE